MKANSTLILVLILFLVVSLCSSFNKKQPKGQEVAFVLGEDTGIHRPTFYPKPEHFTLTPADVPGVDGFDFLKAGISLGPLRDQIPGQLVVIMRTVTGQPYDGLIVDNDRDGTVSNDTIIQIKPTFKNSAYRSYWVSTAKVPYNMDSKTDVVEYPFAVWTSTDSKSQQPNVLNFMGLGYLISEVVVKGVEYAVVLSDYNNDGAYDDRDVWTLRPAALKEHYKEKEKHFLNEPCEANGKWFMLSLESEAGLKGVVYEVPPPANAGAQTQQKQMPQLNSAEAAKIIPVNFYTDYKQAVGVAKLKDAPLFLAFESNDCADCLTLYREAFTSPEVRKATSGLLMVRVNVDTDPKTAKKYKVGNVPSGMLISPDEHVLGSYSGLQSGPQLAAFFNSFKHIHK